MSYRDHFDNLGQRMEAQHTRRSYSLELIEALILATVIAIPFIVYFAEM